MPPPCSGARGWVSYRSANFGFTLQYPTDGFLADPAPSDEGKTFLSREGRARLVISAAVNTSGMPLTAHRRWLMEGAYQGAGLRLSSATWPFVRALRHVRGLSPMPTERSTRAATCVLLWAQVSL